MISSILLIAHGSRRPEANADLVEVAKALQERVQDRHVGISYLELAEPSIPQGLEQCREQGAAEIAMLPYFLSAGSHVTRDLENFRQEFHEKHPDIKVRLCPPLGLHPKIVDVLTDRLCESLDSLSESIGSASPE